jgi:hypothetical protein
VAAVTQYQDKNMRHHQTIFRSAPVSKRYGFRIHSRLGKGRRLPAHRAILKPALFLSLTTMLAGTSLADIRIKRKTTFKRGGYESIMYLKGARQREEMNQTAADGKQFSVAYLEQCDLKQFVWLDLQNKRYAVHTGGMPMGAAMAFNEPQVQVNQELIDKAKAHSKGVLTETTQVIDTGERREMFGYTARHIKTVTTWDPQPKKCDGPELRRETDGWYIDLLYGIDCSPDLSGSITRGYSLDGKCFSEYLFKRNYWVEHKRNGPSTLGYPLLEITKWNTRKGEPNVTRTEVLEMSTEPLSSSLFEVPEGFARAEVQKYQPSLFDRLLSFIGRR